jgi:hypothetical protein
MEDAGRPPTRYSTFTRKELFGRIFGSAENRALRGFRRRAGPTALRGGRFAPLQSLAQLAPPSEVSLSPFRNNSKRGQHILKRRVSFREIRPGPNPDQCAGSVLGRGCRAALSPLGVFRVKLQAVRKLLIFHVFFAIPAFGLRATLINSIENAPTQPVLL